MKEFDGELKFGDTKAIAFVKRIAQTDITKKKISIDYKTLVKIGLNQHEALDILKRLFNLKRK